MHFTYAEVEDFIRGPASTAGMTVNRDRLMDAGCMIEEIVRTVEKSYPSDRAASFIKPARDFARHVGISAYDMENPNDVAVPVRTVREMVSSRRILNDLIESKMNTILIDLDEGVRGQVWDCAFFARALIGTARKRQLSPFNNIDFEDHIEVMIDSFIASGKDLPQERIMPSPSKSSRSARKYER